MSEVPSVNIYLTKRWHVHLPGSGALREGMSSLSFLERAIVIVLSVTLLVSTLMMLGEIRDIFSRSVPSPGGALTEGIIGTPRFINPVIARSDADKDLVALIYSGLMRPSADGKLIPDLAESYKVSDDGMTYTFTLRGGAVFHDGSRVTANDVTYTITQIQNPLNASPFARAWEGISASAVDERTVVFKLGKPYAQFIDNTTVGILPRTLWQETTEETFAVHRLNVEPIGSGPFMIDSIERDNSGIPFAYKLKRFPRFTLGSPYLEHITIMMYGNERDLLSAFEEGTVESLRDIQPSYAETAETVGAHVSSYPLPRTFAAFFNQNKNQIFTDRAVRGALSMAIDRTSIINEILYGYATPLEGPLPPPLIPADKIVDSTTVGEARTVLENAGWSRGDDGIYAKKSERLAFTISTANTAELKQTAEALQGAWETLGAEVTVELFDLGALHQNIIRPRAYDVLLFGQVVGRGGDLYPFWHSSQRNDPGLNIALYTNIAVDDILSDIRTTLDAATQDDLYASLDSEITADVPAVFLYAPHLLYALPEWVKGVVPGPVDEASERFMNVYEWHTGTRTILTASPVLNY